MSAKAKLIALFTELSISFQVLFPKDLNELEKWKFQNITFATFIRIEQGFGFADFFTIFFFDDEDRCIGHGVWE